MTYLISSQNAMTLIRMTLATVTIDPLHFYGCPGVKPYIPLSGMCLDFWFGKSGPCTFKCSISTSRDEKKRGEGSWYLGVSVSKCLCEGLGGWGGCWGTPRYFLSCLFFPPYFFFLHVNTKQDRTKINGESSN